MAKRNTDLQILITATEAAIQARAADYPEAMALASRIFSALETPVDANAATAPTRVEPCRHLDGAFAQARKGPGAIAALTDAFAKLAPAFAWHRRPETDRDPAGFQDNHANAIIVGRGGLEEQGQALIGVSLLAPGIEYPRHNHPPEELYIVLSPGKWMQNDAPLTPKRSGDLIHNAPNTWHAMQAMNAPLLAIWCLWLGA